MHNLQIICVSCHGFCLIVTILLSLTVFVLSAMLQFTLLYNSVYNIMIT